MPRTSSTPAVPHELFETLERHFPNKLPDGTPDLRLIDRMIGQQDVLQLLSRWRGQPDSP